MTHGDYNIINRNLDKAMIESQEESILIAVVVFLVMLSILLRSMILAFWAFCQL